MNTPALQTIEAASQAIDRAREVHVAAVNAGDAEAWAACFTADGVQMPPGFPAKVGSDVIRSWAEAFLAPFEVDFAISPNEVQVVSPDFAFESGTWEITLTPRAGGEPISDVGKHLTVYQRQPDDTWAVARDIWNSSTPPPGAS